MRKLFLIGILYISGQLFYSCNKESNPETSDVVINELMAFNYNHVADQNGEYDDWIELYNLSGKPVNLSGYYLTDSKVNLIKWSFPDTLIEAHSYLIIWTDGDTLQYGLHTNYKLSTEGETVLLLDPELNVVDRVKYESHILQESFARIPNGTGAFSWQSVPTFNSENLPNQ